MFIGRDNTSQRWIDILGHRPEAVVIDKWGYGFFTVNAMSASVWVDSDAVSSAGLAEKLYGLPIFPHFSVLC
jgi:alpha-amylase